MSGNKEREKTEDIRGIQRNIELVDSPSIKIKAQQVAKVPEKAQQRIDMDTS